jgi:NET1-associated nuclear protein 1 (U3 small nucleolar RNA-associated protein 17)
MSLRPVSYQGCVQVTAVLAHPAHVSQAFTASLDGFIRLWDLSDGAPIKAWNLSAPIRHMVVSPDASTAYATVLKGVDLVGKKAVSYVNEINLVDAGKQKRLFKCRAAASLALSARGDTLFAVARKDLLVWSTDDAPGDKEPRRLRHARNLVAVAAHPQDAFVAVGDERGEIFRWYSAAGALGTEVCSKDNMHWHAHAVRCLGASEDGSYLLSGGEEGVLVLWQIETGHRQYLPRLGGAINALATSACGTIVAVLCQEQTIQLVNLLTRKVQRTLRMLPLPAAPTLDAPPAGAEPGTGAAALGARAAVLGVEPRHGYVMLNPRGTTLQLWDALSGRHVGSVEATTRNHVKGAGQLGGGGKQRPIPQRVLLAAFSAGGDSLALVHGREDAGGAGGGAGGGAAAEMQLSFWGKKEGSFAAQTKVMAPHAGRVGALAYSPTADAVVSAGDDGTFKLWDARRAAGDGPGAQAERTTVWRCSAVGSFRAVGSRAAAYSRDGSVLAVAFASSIPLYAADGLALQGCLTNAAVAEPVEALHFTAGAPYLVAASPFSLAVWELRTMSLAWWYDTAVASVAVHPTLPEIAVGLAGDEDGHVAVCAVHDAVPQRVVRLRGDTAPAVVFAWRAEGERGEAELLAVSPARGFTPLGGAAGAHDSAGAGAEEPADPQPAGAAESERPGAQRQRAAFDAIYGAGRRAGAGGAGPAGAGTGAGGAGSVGAARGNPGGEMLDGPAHVLPPCASIAPAFLAALLPPAPRAEPAAAAPAAARAGDAADGEAAEAAAAEAAEAAATEAREVPRGLGVPAAYALFRALQS